MKLFISYARVDKPLCKQIAEHLQDVHEVWYDRRLHAGQQWWAEIVERLAWCDGFVYLLSPESVASKYCQQESEIASAAGKHIFPVLIQARTAIPDSLNHIHYADLSEGMEDMITLMNALLIAERKQRKPRANPAPKAADMPRKAPEVSSNEALAQAADAMEAEHFDDAVFTLKQALDKNPSGRMKRILEHMLAEAETALEKQTYLREASREYGWILELVNREATRALGCEEFGDFRQQFPDYDPDNVAALCAQIAVRTEAEIPRVTEELRSFESPPVEQKIEKPRVQRVKDVLPQPFEWMDIPAGKVTLEDGHGEFTVAEFSIAKYPVTNAQYQVFVDAEDGYRDPQWWAYSQAAASWRKKHAEPDKSSFARGNLPRTDVTWYEAVAFCRWLSAQTGEGIMLPTEQQWQRAAQGDDGRTYPWGNQAPNKQLCNFGKEVGQTTPVTQYPSGVSPYGVMDMAGNVWEWCANDYENPNNYDLAADVKYRALRGGSWFNYITSRLRAAVRDRYVPSSSVSFNGFRCVRSQ